MSFTVAFTVLEIKWMMNESVWTFEKLFYCTPGNE